MEPSTAAPPKMLNVALFGAQADTLIPDIQRHENLRLTEHEPDVVVCFGGDGTLLAAELHYPGLPKVPILNSRRGHRCIPQPAGEVIDGLGGGCALCEQLHQA
jgi:NAD+ kinase